MLTASVQPSSRQPSPSRVAAIFIATYLLFQLLLPLRYYLNRPTPDERFAWRMFSYQSRRACVATVWDDRRVEAGRVVSVRLDDSDLSLGRWRSMLQRERPSVIDKFLRHRMEQAGVESSRVVLRCTELGIERPYTVTYSIDADRIVERTADAQP